MEEKFIGYAMKSQPLGGGLRMSQVAKVIHFLLGDAASAITGECIRVDNGYHVAMVKESMGSHMGQNTGLHNDKPAQERLKPSTGPKSES